MTHGLSHHCLSVLLAAATLAQSYGWMAEGFAAALPAAEAPALGGRDTGGVSSSAIALRDTNAAWQSAQQRRAPVGIPRHDAGLIDEPWDDAEGLGSESDWGTASMGREPRESRARLAAGPTSCRLSLSARQRCISLSRLNL